MKKYLKLTNILLVIVILGAFVLMLFSAKMNAQTTDEGVHLFAGYSYLVKRDYRLDPEHPPLLKELSALPILAIKNIQANFDSRWQKAGNFYYDSWEEARSLGGDFLYSWGNSPEKLLFWGRLISIISTMILGIFGFFWARKLYGEKAGLLAAFLILFFPNFLAHGSLINTDLGLTLFIFISIYFWGKYLKNPSWMNILISGIFIGLAFSSKFTAIILIPIIIILAIVKIILDKNKKDWWKYLLGLVGIKIIAFMVVWASYGFSLQIPADPQGTLSHAIGLWTEYKNQIPIGFNGIYPHIRNFPFPADFYKGFILVGRHAIGGHSAYLWGMNSITGWWYYFPVAIAFKTPIALFVLSGLTLYYWKKIKAKNIFDEYLLIIPPIIFLGFAMYSKADLGYRHILPIFPFIFVFVSKSINLFNFDYLKNIFKKPKKAFISLLLIVLVIWYFISSVLSFPNYISYFNEFAGGPKGGYKILTDSNLDWGQDIYRIKNYIDKNNLGKVYLVYPWDGASSLSYYKFDYQTLSRGEVITKGKVIIGATFLENGDFDWLKKYPSKQITPGVFLIDVN